jgi:hypothetical protein
MKFSIIFIIFVALSAIGVTVADKYYVSKLESQFLEIEKQRIIVSNKLNTAKIVHENLNHVHELVMENMVFDGKVDSLTQETKFFKFVTECVNDLKLELVSVKPVKPKVVDRITNYGYDIEVVGDFFKFGELCAKFENSRKIISLDKFKVSLETKMAKNNHSNEHKSIRVNMLLTTYMVKKEPMSLVVEGVQNEK